MLLVYRKSYFVLYGRDGSTLVTLLNTKKKQVRLVMNRGIKMPTVY